MKIDIRAILLVSTIILSILFTAGCIKINISDPSISPSNETQADADNMPGSADEYIPDKPEPVIVLFTADPVNIGARGASTLSWDVTGAEQILIDQGIGKVDPSGSVMVTPNQTTTYKLTATSGTWSKTAIAMVIVTSTSPSTTTLSLPYIKLFAASPEVINSGEISTISWIVENAQTVDINPAIFRQLGDIPHSGDVPTSPDITTSYILTAINAAGTSEAMVTIVVNAPTTASQLLDWTGTWDTNWGMMYLSQSNGKVTGTYAYDEGKITGYISKNLTGDILVGKWSETPTYTEPDDAGDIEFTMSSDGNSFTGHWRYGSSGDWNGDWYGTRVDS